MWYPVCCAEGSLCLAIVSGSERVAKSEATGERLEEAKHINRSLSALGDVMSALANKDARHVPFRNSKLTQLLQDSLCGQAKAMMFIHVAPEVRLLFLSIAYTQHLLTVYMRFLSPFTNRELRV